MKRSLTILFTGLALVSCNPFAPGLDSSEDDDLALVGDPTTIDGVFQNIRFSYTFRDTTIYGRLLDDEYVFVYRDYDRGIDDGWGRDDEMRITHGLFQSVQRLDLVWSSSGSESTDSLNLRSIVVRSFNLTVTFNPSDIIRVNGYANLTLERSSASDPWRVVRWRDESNF